MRRPLRVKTVPCASYPRRSLNPQNNPGADNVFSIRMGNEEEAWLGSDLCPSLWASGQEAFQPEDGFPSQSPFADFLGWRPGSDEVPGRCLSSSCVQILRPSNRPCPEVPSLRLPTAPSRLLQSWKGEAGELQLGGGGALSLPLPTPGPAYRASQARDGCWRGLGETLRS